MERPAAQEPTGIVEPAPRRYTIAGNRIEDSRECGMLATGDHMVDLKENHYRGNRRDNERRSAGGRAEWDDAG